MKTNPLRRAAYIGLSVLTLGCLLGSFGGWLDRFDDHSEEWAVSQSLIDARIASARDFRKQKAAQDLCLATVGESTAVWNDDGELVCKPKGWKK